MKILKIILNKKNLWLVLPLLSGVLLFLAYPPQNLWFLTWVALIPLFYFLFSEKTSFKKAFWGGAIAGFVYMGGLFIWLFYTAPFEWLGVSSQKDFRLVLLLMIILWLFQIILLALSFAAFSWLAKRIIRKNSGLFSFLLIIPSFWIVFEYLRAWWFEFIWLGKETLFGPHWTFGILAYDLHKIPLFIQSADIWGIYGISFLIVLINSIFFFFVKSAVEKKKLFSAQIIASCLIIIVVFSFLSIYGNLKMKNREIGQERKIALIQTDFVSDNTFNSYRGEEKFNIILDLFKKPESLGQNPDFVVAPEGMGIVTTTGGIKIAKYMLKDFWQPGQIYLESEKIIDENNKTKSRLFYYDLENESPLGYYDKRLLVANGDFLPYFTRFLFGLYSYKSNFEQRLYQKGEIDMPTQTPKGIVGGTICSSIVSPQENRQITNNGAEFLAVVSSDAPFHKSNALLEQNLAMSQFRAVENRRYLAQATNMGYAFLIDAQGKIIAKSTDFGNKILFANIQLLDKKTPYTKFGDWIVFAAFVILLIALSYPQVLTFLLQKKKLYN